MTISEKYLKDEMMLKDFISDYITFCKNHKQDSVNLESLSLFFRSEATPTLTEDEKVILRNIDKHFYTKIFRNECLFLRGEHTSDLVFTQYDHLFQFIKERRRI